GKPDAGAIRGRSGLHAECEQVSRGRQGARQGSGAHAANQDRGPQVTAPSARSHGTPASGVPASTPAKEVVRQRGNLLAQSQEFPANCIDECGKPFATVPPGRYNNGIVSKDCRGTF